MKPIILKRWREIDATMISDKKSDGSIEHILFAADCELHRGPKTGKITKHRRKYIIPVIGATRKEADRRVATEVRKRGTRLLKEDTKG